MIYIAIEIATRSTKYEENEENYDNDDPMMIRIRTRSKSMKYGTRKAPPPFW